MISKFGIKKITDNKNIILSALGFMFWLVLVFKSASLELFNTDEFWSWNIAQDLNFYEITQTMHSEGSSFLWYLILKPFTKLSEIIPSIYPMALKYINLIFIVCAMYVLWFFAPFNNFIKLLISVSEPFLIIYPSLARPYSLTILLLFIVAAIYSKRLKYPLIYSILLFLLAHTGLNGAIGTIILGAFFIWDLYIANNRNFKTSKVIFPLFILVSGMLMLAIEWIPPTPSNYVKFYGNIYTIKYFFFHGISDIVPYSIYKVITCIIWGPILLFAIIFSYIKTKSKRFLISFLFCYSAFFAFYIFIAPGQNYHLYFSYIYLIILFWIALDNNNEFKYNKQIQTVSVILLSTFSLLYLYIFRYNAFWFIPLKQFEQSAEEIQSIIPKHSEIYLIPDFSQDLIYRLKNDYDLKTHYGNKIPSFEAYKNLYHHFFLWPEDMYINKNEENYFIVSMKYTNERFIYHAYEIKDIFDNNENCSNIQDIYILCKLEKKQK